MQMIIFDEEMGDIVKKIIDEMVGKVWKLLGEKGRVDISKLSQILHEKGEIVYQALGWLVREDKIDFHKREGRTFVSLNHKEQEIFKQS
ncbi:MAG: winged helix-turn-helix domain-containing protein [Thermodesulfobacteriota bacterium]